MISGVLPGALVFAAFATDTSTDTCADNDCVATASHYDSAIHYDVLWGQDNIHLGFYPHFIDRKAIPLNMSQAGMALTQRMISLGDISFKSNVLDLGCGKGAACVLIAESTGANCTGIDVSSGNIARALNVARERPDLQLDFRVGSFTDLPSVLHGRFTHVIAQQSFVHVHDQLPTIMQQVKLAMAPTGIAVLNDLLGSDRQISIDTRQAVHDRLGSRMLLGHKAWRLTAEDAELDLQHYENLDKHMALAYAQLAAAAQAWGFRAADGTLFADIYAASSEAAKRHDIGMNLAVYSV